MRPWHLGEVTWIGADRLGLRAHAAPDSRAVPSLFGQVDEYVDLTRVNGHGFRAEGRVIRVSARVHARERWRVVIEPQRRVSRA
jgi:hypothetical protein